MKNPTLLDLVLHDTSLAIAKAYVGAYNNPGTDITVLDDLMVAFRNVRRHISKDENGSRYGSNVAHRAMQGEA
jgi:hypothetical protein